MMTTSRSVLLSFQSPNIQWHHQCLIFSIEIVIWGYPIFRQSHTEQGTRPSPTRPTLQKMRRPHQRTTTVPSPRSFTRVSVRWITLPWSFYIICRQRRCFQNISQDMGLMGLRILFRCMYFFVVIII